MKDFVQSHQAVIKQAAQTYGGVYVAIMDYGDSYQLDLEVVPEAEIAGTWDLGAVSLAEARRAADRLAQEITLQTGCPVFATREEWEE